MGDQRQATTAAEKNDLEKDAALELFHIAGTITSPILTPFWATAPAALNLDCPAHSRQNLDHFARLAVCCSRQLATKPVPHVVSLLTQTSAASHIFTASLGMVLHQRKEQSWLSKVCKDVQMCKLSLCKKSSSWCVLTPGHGAVLPCSRFKLASNCTAQPTGCRLHRKEMISSLFCFVQCQEYQRLP